MLDYVHFARFLPAPDGSMLWVVTDLRRRAGVRTSWISCGSSGTCSPRSSSSCRARRGCRCSDIPASSSKFVNEHNMPMADVVGVPGHDGDRHPRGGGPVSRSVHTPLNLADVQGNCCAATQLPARAPLRDRPSATPAERACVRPLGGRWRVGRPGGDHAGSGTRSRAAVPEPRHHLAGAVGARRAPGVLAAFPPAFQQGPAARASARSPLDRRAWASATSGRAPRRTGCMGGPPRRRCT